MDKTYSMHETDDTFMHSVGKYEQMEAFTIRRFLYVYNTEGKNTLAEFGFTGVN